MKTEFIPSRQHW